MMNRSSRKRIGLILGFLPFLSWYCCLRQFAYTCGNVGNGCAHNRFAANRPVNSA